MDSDILMGRYIIQDVLGAGSGGVVNLAWDTKMNRNVAIKRIRLPRHSSGLQVPGLEEARTGAHLHDSRIVNVFDFEVCNGEALLIMEFVDGMSLGDLMDHIPRMLTLDEVASIAQNVGKALQHAHQSHVLHLDVKPDNIIVDSSGSSKVTDFGIARLAKGSGFGSATAGTIGYMPPEQLRGGQVDERTDQWAFAAMLYELLVGDNPFVADTFMESLELVEGAEIYLPSSIVEGLDPEIDDVLFRALDPNPDDRYESVAAFAKDLLPHLGKTRAGRSGLSSLVRELGSRVVLGSPTDRIATMMGLSDDAQATMSAIPDEDDEIFYTDTGLLDDQNETRTGRDGKTAVYDEREWVPRRRLRNSIGERGARIAARVVGCGANAAIGWLGASAIPFPAPMLSLVAATAAAALGALWPTIGSAASLALLGAGAICAGWLPQGALILMISAIWWMSVGRRGATESNCAVLAPAAGMLGMSMISPIASGYLLPPRKTLPTSIFGAALILILFPITDSTVPWTANPWLADSAVGITDMMGVYLDPSLWLWATGWIAGSLVMSLLANRGSKVISIVGVMLCMGIIICLRLLGQAMSEASGTGFDLLTVAAFAAPLATGMAMIWLYDSHV